MKVKTFQKILEKRNIDLAIFLNTDENKRDKTIFYFAGIDPEFACLLIPKKGNPKLVVASLEMESARKESEIRNIVTLERDFFKQLQKIVGKAKSVGLNYRTVTLNEKKSFQKFFKKNKVC